MKIQISLSGMIKLPPNLVEPLKQMVRQKLLSYALHSTDNNDHIDVHNLIKRLLDDYKISPTSDMTAYMPETINIDISGLPKSYYKMGMIKSGRDCELTIALDCIKQGSNAYYAQPNKIYICTQPLNKILFKKYTVFYRELDDYFQELDSTVEHELTHFVQHNFLHPANYEKKEHYDVKKPDFNKDDYYSSRVEFDPTIRSELGRFLFLMKKYGFPNGDPFGWPNISNCVKSFVCAIQKDHIDYEYSVGQSEFFESLRKVKPKAWKQAIRIFATELGKKIPEQKRKFWHMDW